MMNNRTPEQNFTLRSAKPKAEHKPISPSQLARGVTLNKIERLTETRFKELWDLL